MGNFISNLIARHTTAGNQVLPRLKGRFEPQAGPVREVISPYFPDESQPAEDELPASQKPSRIPRRHPPAVQPPEREEQGFAIPPAAPDLTGLNTISAVPPPFMPPSAAQDAPPHNERPSPVPLKVQVRSSRQPTVTPDDTPVGNSPASIPGTVNNFVTPPSAEKQEGKHPLTADNAQRTSGRSAYFAAGHPTNERAADTPAPLKGATLQPSVVRRLFTGEHDMQRPAASTDNAPNAATPPVIKVTIGRIDVRAVPQPASAKTAGAAPKGVMSLDDYLKKRSGGTS